MTYRPPQWANTSPSSATVVLTFPGQTANAPYNGGAPASLPTQSTVYIFDCVPRISHEQVIVTTDHPVQTGSSISDHAYMRPARLSLEIGMSDTMDSYTVDMWTGGLQSSPGTQSKSVNAFQTLLAIQKSRIPVQITTRLNSYSNMIFESIEPEETYETVTGLRVTIRLRQIFVASTQLVPNSSRPQDTSSTGLGAVTSQTVPAQITSENQIFKSLAGNVLTPIDPDLQNFTAPQVPGAGNFSSTNTSNLISLFGLP